MPRSRILLLLWLAALLIPLGSLRRYSAIYRQAFDAVFSPEWVHIFMHAALYAVLAVLLGLSFGKLKFLDWRTVLIILGIIVLIGVLQEGLQVFSQAGLSFGRQVIGYAVFDIGVDLVGGVIGLMSLYLVHVGGQVWSK